MPFLHFSKKIDISIGDWVHYCGGYNLTSHVLRHGNIALSPLITTQRGMPRGFSNSCKASFGKGVKIDRVEKNDLRTVSKLMRTGSSH